MSRFFSLLRHRFLLAALLCLAFALQANAQSLRYKEAFSAYQTQNFVAAENTWTDLANGGDINAQYALGVMHLRQEASDASPAAAFSWFEKAAKQGHATAMFNLGVAYWEGSGVEQNKSQALSLWEESAGQGDSGAQFNLGLAYYIGEERDPNLRLAAQWISLAADQNHPEAKRILSVINSELISNKSSESDVVASSSEQSTDVSAAEQSSSVTAAITEQQEPAQSTQTGTVEVAGITPQESESTSSAAAKSTADAEENKFWKTVNRSTSLYDTPNGVSFRELPPGTPLEIKGQSGGWAQITLPDGLRTWIYSKYINVDGDRGVINADAVRIRPTPSTNNSTSPPLGKYRRGERVVVLSTQGDWTEIRAPKKISAWLRVDDVVEYSDTEENRQQQWAKSSANGA